ncbi:MAG: O-antigen ligase family protein [Bacteroidota bacterium]
MQQQFTTNTVKNWLLLVSVFCFSFALKVSVVSWVAIGLITLFNKEQRSQLVLNFKKEKYLWLFPFLYLMHLVGLLWTSNWSQAGLDLQIKMTLLLLPVIFSSFYLDELLLNKIRRYFIGGVLLSCLLLLFVALKKFTTQGNITVFFYSELSSAIMHPTYFSMYLNAAMLFVFHEILLSSHRRTIWMGAAVMIILFLFTVLLSARTAEATAFISIIVMVFLYWRRKAGFRFVYPLLVVLSVTALSQLILLKYSNRFAQVENAIQSKQHVTETSYNSTTGRLEIWKEVFSILPDYWLLGTGTGDVKDVLNQTYHQHNFAYGYEKSLNAHNQYLQTFLAIGIVGLLLFILTIKIPWLMRNAYHPLLLMLLFIFALNCITESMLEGQRGAIFFALMISIFGRKVESS